MIHFSKISKFFVIATTIAIGIVTTSTLFPFIVGKYTYFRTAIDVALFFFVLALLFDTHGKELATRTWKVIKSPIGIAAASFTVAVLLACIFGINPSFSFWSNFERGEGGFQILHFFFYFLLIASLFETEHDWRRMMRWFFVGALLMVGYGVAANFGWGNFIGEKISTTYRFNGSIGNSSYVAAFLLFSLCYVVYVFADSLRFRAVKKIASVDFLLGAIAVIFLVFFFLAGTRGAFLGFVVTVIAALLYYAYAHKAWRKWLISGVFVFAALVAVMIQYKDTAFVQAIPGHRVFDISFSAETFSTRRIMWGVAWEGFKERPLFGWGPENYIKVFDQKFDTAYFVPSQQFGAWFDRAHSVTFDYLAETGAFGLLAFYSLFVAYYWRMFTAHKRPEAPWNTRSVFQKAILFALPLGYFVQGIVLFDVLPMYINIFFVWALGVYLFEDLKIADKKHHEERN